MNSRQRMYWVHTMCRIASPVLEALANKQLKNTMPVNANDREQFTYLEALGRTLAGMAPWLESGASTGEEGKLRNDYLLMARKAIDAGTDPNSEDFMNFDKGEQPLVDTAFLAHAILRAPTELWGNLEERVKVNVVRALKSTRMIKPFFNNWLLFAALIETALYRMGEDWDPMRIDFALKQHEQWYKGDGIYGDGPLFRWDYYNSFVIQPMLIDILETVGDRFKDWSAMIDPARQRARRYAVIQERMISPEGTFPAIGRSLTYRFGAFQHLAQMSLRKDLPDELIPAQVRCALTAVIRRMVNASGFTDEHGWLNIGFYGHQPELGERYISTGSLYLCMTVFLPLGLPANDLFWSGEDMDWTSRQVWSGASVQIDKGAFA